MYEKEETRENRKLTGKESVEVSGRSGESGWAAVRKLIVSGSQNFISRGSNSHRPHAKSATRPQCRTNDCETCVSISDCSVERQGNPAGPAKGW